MRVQGNPLDSHSTLRSLPFYKGRDEQLDLQGENVRRVRLGWALHEYHHTLLR